jgi:hypothetical protein
MTVLEIFLVVMGVLVAIALIGAWFSFSFGTNYHMDDPPETIGLPLWTNITTTTTTYKPDRKSSKRYPSKGSY